MVQRYRRRPACEFSGRLAPSRYGRRDAARTRRRGRLRYPELGPPARRAPRRYVGPMLRLFWQSVSPLAGGYGPVTALPRRPGKERWHGGWRGPYALSLDPGGIKEISRWWSAAEPPDTDQPRAKLRPGGTREGRMLSQSRTVPGVTRTCVSPRLSRPAGAQRQFGRLIRWFRCASPPANFLRTSGTREREVGWVGRRSHRVRCHLSWR